MLWVQVPPEPVEQWSSWSSLECSPPCQGGGRGFKSHRGRFQPVGLSVQDAGLSCRQDGFDSHTGYSDVRYSRFDIRHSILAPRLNASRNIECRIANVEREKI